MRSEEEIKTELKRLEDLYRYTNDATVLQKEIYTRMKAMKWVLEDEIYN